MPTRLIAAVALICGCAASAWADTARIAIAGNPPFVDAPERSGIVVDVMREAFANAGIDMQAVFVPVRRSGQELRLGNVDGLASILGQEIDMSPFHTGNAVITYTDYFFTLESRALPVRTPDDLDGLNVVTFPTAVQIYPDWLDKIAVEGRYTEISDQRQQVELLFRERTDAILLDETIMRYLTANLARLRGQTMPPVLQSVRVGGVDSLPAFASTELRDAYNAGLAELQASGRYREIIEAATR